MKNFVVILLLLVFSATQFASLLSDIGAPIIHEVCYGKVFQRRSTGSASQTLFMDSVSFHQSQTDDQEIRVGGHLFDIIAITRMGDSVQIEVNSDEFETQFFNVIHQIREAVKKASGPHHHNKNLQSWLLKLYCPNEATANLVAPGQVSGSYKIPLIPKLQAGIHNRYVQPPDTFI